MSEYPGVPTVMTKTWATLGVFYAVMGIAYGVFALPTYFGISAYLPNALGFMAYAFAGWIVLYSTGTVSFLNEAPEKEIKELVQEMRKSTLGFLFLIIACYINFVIAVGALLGFSVTFTSVAPTFGVIVALLYPGLDIILANTYFSPGWALLAFILGIFHTFGFLRDVTAREIIQDLANPGGQNSPAV